MGYPFELEDRLHQRLAVGDLTGAGRACAQLGEALRRRPDIDSAVLAPLLHNCAWRVRRKLEELCGGNTELPRREELVHGIVDGESPQVVDRCERLVMAMLDAAIDADALAACPALRARAFIDRNFTRAISTKTVARAVACSEAHLCDTFRRVYGDTVGDYIRWRRIERGKGLLSSSRLPVKTVGYKTGFGTYRTFLRNFRALTGMSPRSYRRLARRSGASMSETDAAEPVTPEIPGIAEGGC
ncbi:MAG: AraC family transcriptional regulator [Acidobacteriota bacterium]